MNPAALLLFIPKNLFVLRVPVYLLRGALRQVSVRMARLNDDWQNLDVAIKAFDDMIEEQRSAIRSSVEGEVWLRIDWFACLLASVAYTPRILCARGVEAFGRA